MLIYYAGSKDRNTQQIDIRKWSFNNYFSVKWTCVLLTTNFVLKKTIIWLFVKPRFFWQNCEEKGTINCQKGQHNGIFVYSKLVWTVYWISFWSVYFNSTITLVYARLFVWFQWLKYIRFIHTLILAISFDRHYAIARWVSILYAICNCYITIDGGVLVSVCNQKTNDLRSIILSQGWCRLNLFLATAGYIRRGLYHRLVLLI